MYRSRSSGGFQLAGATRHLQLAVDVFQGQRLWVIALAVSLIRFLPVFDSIGRDLVTFQRKEDAMGADPASVSGCPWLLVSSHRPEDCCAYSIR
jgi:hypothetical protein